MEFSLRGGSPAKHKKMKQTKYIAVGVTACGIWVLLSKPTTRDNAQLFKGCELKNEVFELKTESEVDNHNKVLR